MDFLKEEQFKRVVSRISECTKHESDLMYALNVCQEFGLYGAIAEIEAALDRVRGELGNAIAERDTLAEEML